MYGHRRGGERRRTARVIMDGRAYLKA